MADKPHKGTIKNWFPYYFDRKETEEYYKEPVGLGFLIRGTFVDHPQFGFARGSHTSWIMSHDEKTGEIETRNSRYTLDPPSMAEARKNLPQFFPDAPKPEVLEAVEGAKCELCGEPMAEGETMFKYHGYSGPCPEKS